MRSDCVLVCGHFNVLHPGHIRLFKFARSCASRLIVAIESDRVAGSAAHVAENHRLEGVLSCSLVDDAFIYDESTASLISRLQPELVVKGREHEKYFNPEAEILATYGGRLIFSSGDAQFSSSDLIRKEFLDSYQKEIALPKSFMDRHKIHLKRLEELVKKFSSLRVLTIGDIIVDDYITCAPLGMSQEDPTLVVSPINTQRFIGGAGIVAAHASGLGAISSLISVTGEDDIKDYCILELERFNVQSCLLVDSSRPTTLKERFRSHGKTLLRVSHLQQRAIPLDIQNKIIERVKEKIDDLDLIIFSDFNYGVLPQYVIESIVLLAKEYQVLVAADSQSSSQLGDIGRYKGVGMLLPTEREARVSTQNWEDGLVVLAEHLRQKSNAKYILLKMGKDGVLIHAPAVKSEGWITDQVEALNKFPQDVAGAGDSMLVASALTLAAGGNIWESACIGSLAAAAQVGRVGNIPLKVEDLLSRSWLSNDV
jgi:rfaE bifunctional protein kinase chain/domain